MEINDDHIIELIKGQAATTQAVQDLRMSMEKGFLFFSNEHGKLETRHDALDARVGSVERKVWYGSGAAAAVGFLAGIFGKHTGL